jgi:hypothetical protein
MEMQRVAGSQKVSFYSGFLIVDPNTPLLQQRFLCIA